MDAIGAGALIEVMDAAGRPFTKRAISGVENHGRFPVVWACSEQEWASAEAEAREPEAEAFPWPVSSIRVLTAHG
jgi:hypothetical protein